MKTRLQIALLVAGAMAMALPAHADDITGAGSTFVYPILSKWSADYSAKAAGVKVNFLLQDCCQGRAEIARRSLLS